MFCGTGHLACATRNIACAVPAWVSCPNTSVHEILPVAHAVPPTHSGASIQALCEHTKNVEKTGAAA